MKDILQDLWIAYKGGNLVMFKLYKMIDSQYELIAIYDYIDEFISMDILKAIKDNKIIVLMNNKPLSYAEIKEII